MFLARCVGLVTIAGTLAAQDATFSADVKVVSLLATVRDRDGNVVKGLTRDDFIVKEDGRRQDIRYFAQESSLPLTIGLLVDTSRSMQTLIKIVRADSGRFFEQVLHDPRDVAFVMHFDYKVGVLQGFTASREQLAGALNKLKIPAIPSTLLYDAVVQASSDLMKAQTGRKAFILLSDGMDVRSQASLTTAIEYAQRADTMIYSILFAHKMNRPGRGRGINIAIGSGGKRRLSGPKVMERLARETGGGYFAVAENNPIEKIYAQIEEELRNQYSIGYTPDRSDKDKEFRKITLTTKRKDLIVRTREGYYPK
jgi:VWFA-related protein